MKKHPQPPRLALRFFRWYCHPALAEDIEGDLLEMFEERAAQQGEHQARKLFIRDVLALFRPSIIRPFYLPQTHTAMFKNYFKIGVRNLWKYKSYAALNIFGLAVGITAAILLFLVVRYERSFDKFHSDYENIYRIGEHIERPQGDDTYYLTKTPVLPAMLEEFPEVVNGTRFMDWDVKRLGYEDKMFKCSTIYVDSGFVDLFDFGVLEGDPKATLTTPDHVIVTQSVAQNFFGSASASVVGKILEVVDDSLRYVVGAVVVDPPKNSSLQFDVLVPWLSAPEWLDLDQGGNWYNTFMNAYVQLAPGADPKLLEKKLIPFKDKNFTNPERDKVQMILLPLEKLHAEEISNASVVTLLSIIAVVTLAIACINFMNLSTAQSLGRVREIGLRKVLGSFRGQLVLQFLTESLLTCFAALFIGILLVHLTLPWFNRYFELSINFNYWQNLRLLAVLLSIGLITGLLAGAYPAFFVSGFRPVQSLKGQWKHGGQNFQKALIVLQYMCSMLLIAGTVVIWQQIDFMKTRDLHFDKNNVVVIDAGDENFKKQEQTGSGFEAIKDRLSNETAVVSTAWTENVPGRYNHNYNSFYAANALEQAPVSLRQITVGANYFNTFGIPIREGRSFSESLASDSNAVVINETAMKAFDWQNMDEEKYLYAGEMESGEKYKVVGVVQDYHYQTLQEKIQPVIHFYAQKPPGFGFLAVRLQPDRVAEGVQLLENTYASLNPYEPFSYFFMDQEFDKMYKQQERLGTTATLFAFIAIVVASLGLLGLTSFATRQRRKEIGVRKVLGASVPQVTVLLSRSFVWLVMIAFIVACPLIYYAAQQFLQDFAYRIDIGASIFVVACMVAFFVAGVSVSVQSIRAASANPVHALKDE